MSQKIYSELMNLFHNEVSVYNRLYRLNTFDENGVENFFQEIKTKIIEKKNGSPEQILLAISYALEFNLKYYKQYKFLFKKIYDEYHPTHFDKSIPLFLWSDLIDEHENTLSDRYRHEIELRCLPNYSFEFMEENTIYRAIINDNTESLLTFTERDGFNPHQMLEMNLFPGCTIENSFLELCSYFGSEKCFKLFLTKFNSKITRKCLAFSFLGGNAFIMNECLKHQDCNRVYQIKEFAVASHNIDFITFLKNEHKLNFDLELFCKYHNLQAFFAYFDQTNSLNECFAYSTTFNIPSLCQYFLCHGAKIKAKIKSIFPNNTSDNFWVEKKSKITIIFN